LYSFTLIASYGIAMCVRLSVTIAYPEVEKTCEIVSEIAMAVGYESASTFVRSFK
jgi:AraC-like DNA-binding protein